MTSVRWMNALRTLLVICVACAAVFAGLPSASAQGTSGTLPDPISTPELDEYAAVLNLSEQQRQAIEPMHNQYLEQFRQLRSDEIEEFLDEFRSLRRQLFEPQGFEAIDKATRDHNRIMARITSLDESLFNRIQTVLSDDQMTRLPRARLARERQRYSNDALRFATSRNPGARLDLSEMTRKLDVPTADRQAIDPVLLRYERHLTDAQRQMFDKASGMFKEVTARLAEAGVTGVDRSDPESARTMFRAFEQAWREVNAEVLAEASKVSGLNRRTMRTIAPLMSEDGARMLRHRYYRRAYGVVMRNVGQAAQRIGAALEMTELSEEQRDAVLELRRNYDNRFAGIMEQAIDLLEETRQESRGFRFGRDDDDPTSQKIDEFRDRLSALDDATIEQLKQLLGAELVAALDGRGDEDGKGEKSTKTIVAVRTTGGGAGETVVLEGELELQQQGPTGDPYLPGPITRSDLSSYVQRLGVDEERQAIVESIYAQYVDAFAEINTQYVEPLQELNRRERPERRERGGWRANTPEPDELERTFDLRREGLSSILALDRAFFDDVELLINDDDETAQQLLRIRQARLRDIYNRGEGGGAVFFGGGGRFRGRFGIGGQEERVDLTRAIDDVEMDASAQSAIDPILNAYATEMTDAFRRRYEASIRHAEARQQVFARVSAMDQDDDDRQQRMRRIGQEMRAIGETLGEQVEQTTQQIIDLNRQTLDMLTEALPEQFSRQVREAYYRAGYPGVYNDRNSAQRQVDTAMNLRDLTPSQRSELIDIASEYRGRYDELCMQMVEVQISQPEDSEGGDGPRGRDWQRIQDLRNEMERLRFQRNELNETTIRRIRSVLNDRQIAQVPGLSEDDSNQ